MYIYSYTVLFVNSFGLYRICAVFLLNRPKEKFEDTKVVIRSRKSKRDKQRNVQIKDRETKTTQKYNGWATKPYKTPGQTKVLLQVMKFMLHLYHASSYSCWPTMLGNITDAILTEYRGKFRVTKITSGLEHGIWVIKCKHQMLAE